MTQTSSVQLRRKKKALLLAPVVIVPLITIIFIALGGGKGASAATPSVADKKGFNPNLPKAHLSAKETIMDKLGFYKKAEADSVRLRQRLSSDPYLAGRQPPSPETAGKPGGSKSFNTSISSSPSPDEKANQLLEHLEQLKKTVAAQQTQPPSDPPSGDRPQPYSKSPEQIRLERMLQSTQATTQLPDPQLDRLQGMLDKVYQIQHPEKVDTGRNETTSPSKTNIPSLTPKDDRVVVEQIDSSSGASQTYELEMSSSFMDISEASDQDSVAGNIISAVIPVDQELVAGATIELRLLQEAVLGKVTIPKNTLVFGKASINGDRLQASIISIRVGSSIYPVSLQMFDLDGLLGLHIPGAISRDVAKESADQGINSIGATGATDGSIGAQAANATIQTARTLFSRKIRLVRVWVKSGYQVLLKNNKN
jgi:conjugative transposon TraM protein